MDWDDRFGLDNNVSFLTWIRKYDGAREMRMTDWVSTFHPERVACKLTTHKLDDRRGAYNMTCKVEFNNGEKWMVRFPMVGKVVNADEKTEIEVATVKLIRPFIIMNFIEGISVHEILQKPGARIMREDLSEQVVERLFRQTINFSLQLRNLDLPRIGSLTPTSIPGHDNFAATIHSRPVTKRSHDFRLDSGIDVFGPQDGTFTSTGDYFLSIIERDLQHLNDQPNSVDDEHDAREKFIYFNVMKALIRRHILPDLDGGPFKLTCDYFQPTNMIVNNREELKVISVVDWEWSYTAPAQLVNSTPPWLLIECPNAWSLVDDRLTRFYKQLELYMRILEEEEPKVLIEGIPDDHKPSTILRTCQDNGLQWFHILLLRGFNGPTCVPFEKLREETQDWNGLVSAIPKEDINSFVAKKVKDLQEYEKQLAEIQGRYKTALEGNMDDLKAFLRESESTLPLGTGRREWRSWACFH